MNIFTNTLNSAFGAVVGKEVEEGKKLILGDPAKVSEAFIIGGITNPKGFRTPSFKTGNTRKRKRMGRGVVGGNVVKRDWIPEWAGSERGNKRREQIAVRRSQS